MNTIAPSAPLSAQERRVIVLSMEGLGDKEIAQAMGLSIGTVRTYWKRIAAKIGGSTRAEIVSTFAREGSQEALDRERTLVAQLAKEVAQRREAEAKFRAICACSPTGIYVCDEAGRCLYVNPAWERITGIRATTLKEPDWRTMIHPEDYDGLQEWWRGHVLEGPPEPTEFRFVTPRGLLQLRTSFAPMVIDGRIAGYVGTIEKIGKFTA